MEINEAHSWWGKEYFLGAFFSQLFQRNIFNFHISCIKYLNQLYNFSVLQQFFFSNVVQICKFQELTEIIGENLFKGRRRGIFILIHASAYSVKGSENLYFLSVPTLWTHRPFIQIRHCFLLLPQFSGQKFLSSVSLDEFISFSVFLRFFCFGFSASHFLDVSLCGLFSFHRYFL